MAESEIAQVRRRIDAEHEAGRLALAGPAYGTAQHQFIEARMEHLASVVAGLIEEFGPQGAQVLIVAAMEREVETRGG